MAWYVVHVGRVPKIYLTWKIAMLKSIATQWIVTKKYIIEAEAFRAYYGVRSVNRGHQLVLEIEEEPHAGDMKIGRIAPWSWKDVMLLFMAMVIAFLIWKLM
jgi:hypothetical protein